MIHPVISYSLNVRAETFVGRNFQAVNSSGLSAVSKYVTDDGIEDESDEEELVEENEEDEDRNLFLMFLMTKMICK